MKTTRFFAVLFSLIHISSLLNGQTYEKLDDYKGVKSLTPVTGISSPVNIHVIYDNYVSKNGTKSDWGFSLFIEGLEKGLLFDTGTNPEIFELNLNYIGIDPSAIDLLVLSHEHYDHTGGISSLVKIKAGLPVLMPASFSARFKEQVAGLGLKPVMATAPSVICQDLFTSGEFEFVIPEEALVIDTKKGLVVLTGCAHPGIINMLRKIKDDFDKNIYMVCGGFHLMNKTDKEMNTIISDLKNLGIVKCGATHCTGENQIKMLRVAFGENFIEMGTGNTIVLN